MHNLYSHYPRGIRTPDAILRIFSLHSTRSLPSAPPDDPCFPNAQYIILPTRSSCNKLRLQCVHYRAYVRRLSEKRSISPELRADYTLLTQELYAIRISMRNPRHPLTTDPIALYKLPDGIHHLYFLPQATTIDASLNQLLISLEQERDASVAEDRARIERRLSHDPDPTAFTEALSELGYIPSSSNPNPDPDLDPDPDSDDLTGSSDALSDLGWISPGSSSPSKKK